MITLISKGLFVHFVLHVGLIKVATSKSYFSIVKLVYLYFCARAKEV